MGIIIIIFYYYASMKCYHLMIDHRCSVVVSEGPSQETRTQTLHFTRWSF